MILSKPISLSFINTLLRGLTLVSKFLLMFFLAKFLSPAKMGEYGLITVSISYLLYLLGLDFYTFSTREMLATDCKYWGVMLRDQIILYLLCYLLVIPATLLIFTYNFLDWQFATIFYLLLVLEQINQEISRVLITISKPVAANVLAFFRGGLWCYAVLACFFIFTQEQPINTVLYGWLFGDLIALGFGAFCLRHINWQECRKTAVNWKWINKGVRVSLKLLAGTLALRGIIIFDRYILAFYEGKEIVGVYVFYAGIANAAMSFLDVAVFIFFYPKLIEAVAQKNILQYQQIMKQMLRQTVCILFILVVLASALIYPVINALNKEVYATHLSAYFILMAAVVIFYLGMIPHFGLYAMKKDKLIFLPHILVFIIFLMIAFILIPLAGILGAALSVFISYLLLGLIKLFSYRKISKNFLLSNKE